jgi:hypothetical protein
MSDKIKVLFVTLLLTFSFGAIAAKSIKGDYEEFKIKASKKIDQLEIKLEKLKIKSVKYSGEAKDKLVAEYASLKQKTAKYKEDLSKSSDKVGDFTEEKWKSFKDKMEDYGDKIESKLDDTIN